MGSITVDQNVQPDIAYSPNWQNYSERSERRQRSEQLQTSLPPSVSSELASDLVWDGATLSQQYNWILELNVEQIEEIEDALQHFKSLNLPLGHISKETFPLPNLHQRLRDVSRELHLGHGFKVIRGIPVDKYSRADNIAIYAGISSHIAAVRGRQDSSFDGKPASVVLAHIKDLSTTSLKGTIGAPAYTTDKQVFHTDSGDIVALFALSSAASGGTSRLASTWRVYNELAKTRPDLIHTLLEDWPFDTFGNTAAGFHCRPLLYHQSATTDTPERVLLQYARRYFTGYGSLKRSSHIPPITEAQAEALDTLHFLGERFNIGTTFQKGDIQYINNLAVFHARDAFVDTPEMQRHLLRLWLRDPEYAWSTPPQLQETWDKLYKDVRPDDQVFPVDPYVRSASNSSAPKAAGNTS